MKRVLTLCFVLLLALSPVMALEPEEKFKIDVSFYSNESKASINNVSIVESRQISAFSKNADTKFVFEDQEGSSIKNYYKEISFETISESFSETGEYEIIEEGQRDHILFMDYFESAENLSIYRSGDKIVEVNLKGEICGEQPCHEFCSDVINQSELDSCESYEGFNQTDDGETTQGHGDKTLSNQVIVIIILALATIFTSAIYYRRRRDSEEE